MPSPTDAERIIISRERIIILCAPGTLNFCADALRASTRIAQELAPLLSVGRLKRCKTESCVMISLFAAARRRDFTNRPIAQRIFALDCRYLCNFLVRDSHRPTCRCRRSASEELLERFARFGKTRHRERHQEAEQQSGKADAAKTSRSGSATIETTPSRTFGFCSIRRSTASTISRSVRQYELLIAASMLARPAPISAAALASDRAFRVHKWRDRPRFL